MKNTFFLIIVLFVLAILSGLNYVFRPLEKIEEQFVNPQVEQVFNVEEKEMSEEEKILANMSDEEKINQILAMPINLKNQKEEEKNQKLTENFGFFVLFGEDISQQEINDFKNELDINESDVLRPFLTVDHEGGQVQRLSGEGFSKLPSWQELCYLDETEMESQLASSATELSKSGIDMILAPMLDVGTNNALGNRICSNDSQLTTERALDFIKIFNSSGVQTVVKHFPGIGKTTKDLHTQFDSIEVEESDALPFINILEKYPNTPVMVSHVGVINQYEDIPCSLSGDCIYQLSENFPDSLVFSDALNMKSAFHQSVNETDEKTIEQISVEAIEAGVNVLLYGELSDEDLQKVRQTLLEKYQSDETFREKVDVSLKKTISFKIMNT